MPLPLIFADQLLAHAVGDYALQSDWMAREKTSRISVALAHAVCYSLPFLLLRPSLAAWLVIVLTHAVIDRYRLARYVVWAKEWLSPMGVGALMFGRPFFPPSSDEAARHGAIPPPLPECPTGYPADKPPFMAVWLLIIVDNSMHIFLNGIALRYL